MTYPSNWFVGVSEDDKKKILDVLKYSPAIQRLVQMVEADLKSLEPSRTDYENTSWAYLQAHKNGEKIALERVLKLLRPTEKP